MAKGYKRYTLSTAMALIREQGLREMTANELRSVGRPLMTAVKKELKNLRAAGYKDSPAYSAYKSMGLKTSTSATNRNILLNEVYNAYTFLNSSTSTVFGVERYLDKVSNLFGREVTLEESRLIWSASDKLRKENSKLFEDFSYNVILQEIAFQAKGENDAREVMENVKYILEHELSSEQSDPFNNSDDREFWT